jgi:protein-S-isoprenylcysteine O-methyltransferase Ste14
MPSVQNSSLNVSRSKLAAKLFLQAFVTISLMDGILFGFAGRIAWPAAWVLTLLFALFFAAIFAWGLQNVPELLEERSKVTANGAAWDRWLLGIYQLLLVALLIVAALDAGRFRRSAMPLALQGIAALGFVAGGAVIWWCMSANAYLSRFALIQNDRGQKVAQNGPYRFVRHPMYAAIAFLAPCIALLLASWWALIPAVLIAIVFVLRTALEDRMLIDGLAGYAEYAAKVPYRLLAGIW